jgi:hypothetical protein
VQYKTPWVLLMKLRETIAARRDTMVLEGEVEIDGKYAGGNICPENKEVHARSPKSGRPYRSKTPLVR